MAIREIRFDGDEVLEKRCKEVIIIDDHIRTLLDDMMETLHTTPNGAALAANQVGILRRLVVIDFDGKCLKLVNPKIIGSSGSQECIEGCLSYPGRFGKTIRPQSVTIQALDENGEKIILTEEGEMAKCFCHEIEHLDGEIFLDKVIEFLK